jgi:thermitase
VLVRFKPGTSPSVIEDLHRSLGAQVVKEIPEIGIQVLRMYDDAIYAVFAYQNHSGIEFAEPDYLARVQGWPVGPVVRAPAHSRGQQLQGAQDDPPAFPLRTPDDPLFGQQWHLPQVSAPSAWDRSLGDQAVVAVVDSGVQCTHSDLSGKCLPGYDFVNQDTNPDDDHGHGTHVAGIAGARTDNGRGVAGAGWNVKIMPVKVLGAGGSGSHSAIASGIVWAADHGADVINLSLGGPFTSNTLRNAVLYARNRGAVVVAAAGNDNTSNPSYPAAYPEAVGVSATTQSDGRASFSNYGTYVDIASPGAAILSTVRGGSYQAWSGTSMAAPVVSGAVALLVAQDSSRTAEQLENLLFSSADDRGTTGWDQTYGHGRLNAGRALNSGVGQPTNTPVRDAPQATSTPPPSITPIAGPSVTPSINFVQQLEDLINQRRVGSGLPALGSDARLREAAQLHSEDMRTNGFCGHFGSDGSSPSTRMRDSGYTRPYGETVACGHPNPAAVVDAWMASDAHRDIIMCASCTQMGSGYASGGFYRHYWVLNLGREASAASTPTTAATQPPPPTPTLGQATATRTSPPPSPTSLPGTTTLVLMPAADSVGWVISSQPDANHFHDDDTYTGRYNNQLYHGAMQFDLGAVPSQAQINWARLEMVGQTTEFLGTSGTWAIRILASSIDQGWTGHGYALIHGASVEETLLPLLGVANLGTGVTNTFVFDQDQLRVLSGRIASTRRLSIRLDGPPSGTGTNLFTWDSGHTAESTFPGPRLTINYGSQQQPLPVTPSPTLTEMPPEPTDPPPSPTLGPTPTITDTPPPPTSTSTAPPQPSRTATFTPLPPTPTSPPQSSRSILIPASHSVGWVAQGVSGNRFGDDDLYTGVYNGRIYHGAFQFDLAAIPRDARIVQALLELVGQDATNLDRSQGTWRVRMLHPEADAGWPTHDFARIDQALAITTLAPVLHASQLDAGLANGFPFDAEQRALLEDRLRGTRYVSFRLDGPSSGRNNIFSWDSGYGTGLNSPPRLHMVWQSGGP